MPSALLSKSIAEYNANLKEMISYLKSETILSEVCTHSTIQHSFDELY